MTHPDHVWHLAGEYEGYRAERYGSVVMLTGLDGRLLVSRQLPSEAEARGELFHIVADVYQSGDPRVCASLSMARDVAAGL